MSPHIKLHKVLVGRTIVSLSALFVIAMAICLRPPTTFAAEPDDCLTSARNYFGEEYVENYEPPFIELCDSVATISSPVYGMLVPEYIDFLESDGISGEIYFDAVRLIYSNSGDNNYATYESLSPHMTFSESTLNARGNASVPYSWRMGDSMTVQVTPELFSDNPGLDSGLIEVEAPLTTCPFGADCEEKTLYFKVHEITNIVHGDAVASAAGGDYEHGDTIETTEDSVTLSFTHHLARYDNWTNPSSVELTNVYKKEMAVDDEVIESDYNWRSLALGASGDYTDVTDEIAIGLEPGDTTEVCSTIIHRNVKSLVNDYISNVDGTNNKSSSTICVTLKNTYVDPDDPDVPVDPDDPSGKTDPDEGEEEAPAIPNTGLVTDKDGSLNVSNLLLAILAGASTSVFAFFLLRKYTKA